MLESQKWADLETGLEQQIKPLSQRLEQVRTSKRKALAAEWISANKVTRDQVQVSHGDGIPYFGHVTLFIDWLKETASTKRFAEWNTQIHFMGDLLAGRFVPQPATIDDLV